MARGTVELDGAVCRVDRWILRRAVETCAAEKVIFGGWVIESVALRKMAQCAVGTSAWTE